jgi:CBS domain containing-hemolysin-like protein
MAYLSINKLHVELERQKGGWNYKVLGYLVDRPAAFIAAILVGNNVALVLYGNYMHQFLEPYFFSVVGIRICGPFGRNFSEYSGYFGLCRIFAQDTF